MLRAQNILFQQLFEKKTSTYTYLLADANNLEGIIIDPVIDTLERDLKLIEELGIRLLYILETHVHADHITSSGLLADKTGATVAMSAHSGAQMDLPLYQGQELLCGHFVIKALETPGHTKGCMSFLIANCVFTGDTLLIRGNGRTDFQEGSPETLYESIMHKLYALPDNTLIFPAHDYLGFTSSSIGMEKKYNKRIRENTTKEEFIQRMNALHLDPPQQIDLAVPANLRCGRSG